MGLLRAVVVLLAAAAVAGGLLQELRQVSIVARLEPRKALAHYERRRRRSDQLMVIVSIVLALGGAGALAFHLIAPR